MNKGETPRFLIFAGTVEGRTLAGELAAAGCPVTVSVATEYGEKLVEEQPGLTVHRGRMTAEEMATARQALAAVECADEVAGRVHDSLNR